MAMYLSGKNAELPYTPKRVVSLVPSQTELLYDLGLENEVVGITKFCVHPETWFRQKTRIGGTKQIHIEKVAELQPDLILANKEENVKDQILTLQEIAPVWVSDIDNYATAINMMQTVGRLTHREKEAAALIEKIEQAFEGLLPLENAISTAYLIWKDPYMTVGHDTFIHDMLERIGLKNVFGTQSRYPIISLEMLQKVAPQLILLSSEPYPFKEKHIHELQKMLPDSIIQLTNGELFSWYGSRMQYAPAYFSSLLKDLHIKSA